MKIIIAGAGEVGFHLARLLETEHHDIILLDRDEQNLEYAGTHLDVKTVYGDAASPEALELAGAQKANLFIAVTTYESTNLLSCTLAKRIGSDKTIARISNPEYLRDRARTFFKSIGVDNLYAPSMLAAKEIDRLIHRISATDVFDFEEGKISIIGFTVDDHSPIVGSTLREIHKRRQRHTRTLGVHRHDETIMPHDDLVIQGGDHIYLSTGLSDFNHVNSVIGKNLTKVKRVMIAGSTHLALYTAQLLEKEFELIVVVDTKDNCRTFVQKLKRATVIQGKASDVDLLKEEGLAVMDAFIGLSDNPELNIISCLIAENAGVNKTIALVDNSAYTGISQRIGVDTLINKKILAANNIFRFVRKGEVEAIASFHGVDAEVIEFFIQDRHKLIGNTIDQLKLPHDAIVAGVVRGEEGWIPDASYTIAAGDKIILFVRPTAMARVENLFNR